MDKAIDQSADESRRRFLAQGGALAAASCLAPAQLLSAEKSDKEPKRIATVTTIYRPNSHSYHICRRFLDGFSREGVHYLPKFRVVRMFIDQYPAIDIGRRDARRYGIELTKTVGEALGANGKLDVDAVLLIGEHGDYPFNELGQHLYPRYEMFEQIAEVFRRNGRGVPVFNDKHLSHDHRLAQKMVATADKLKFGLMAGSSLPVTWRRPEIEPDLETPFTEGLVCHGGKVEAYGFHGLETLQCMLERRKGGETGVRSVTCLEGDAVWKAGDQGLWSWKLLRAALSRSPSQNIGKLRDNVQRPVAIIVEYQDGTRGTALNLAGHTTDFCFAGRIAGRERPISSCFFLPNPPGAKYFDALSFNIEKHFVSGKPPYPIERTLLTSTVLDLAMHSLSDGGKMQQTKALDVRYHAPRDSGFFRGRYTDAG